MVISTVITVASSPPPPPRSPRTPFCDKEYKMLRVVAERVAHLCLGIFYYIISKAVCFFNPSVSYKYDCLAYLERIKSQSFFVYRKFGNEVVDFSTNSFPHVIEPLSTGNTELDALKMLYGAEKMNRLREHAGQMKRCGIGKGCCLGMSLDFISSYLRQMRLGMSALQAIKSIAPDFVDGPSENAQLCQILSEAGRHFQDIQPLPENVERTNIPKVDLEKELIELEKVDLENDLEELEMVVEKELCQRYENVVPAFFNLIKRQPLSMKQKDEFEALVRNLPSAAYQISAIEHSIVFIKTEERIDFVFDPNIGTLAVEHSKSSERLWNVISRYRKEGDRLIFTPCELA